jgi:hypothetical protein
MATDTPLDNLQIVFEFGGRVASAGRAGQAKGKMDFKERT